MSELLEPLEAVRPDILEAVLEVGRKIGWAAHQGRHLGALFVVGDCSKVLQGSWQLVPNPFLGRSEEVWNLADPVRHDMLADLLKLGGAFVIRGDGFIETAATYLALGSTDVDLPANLGTRHMIAASVTARTRAVAVTVSSSDGNVRMFTNGGFELEIDPSLCLWDLYST